MKKGFTIIELLLAVGLLAVLLVVSGAVFRMATKAYRTAAATGEIARKLRAVTDQIDADFRGIRKDGIVFFVWVPAPVDKDGRMLFPGSPGFNAANVAGYRRFDRAFFFADGDFKSYAEWPCTSSTPPYVTSNKIVHGNVARIGYMVGHDASNISPQNQPAAERVLARSQHILIKDPLLVRDLDGNGAAMPVPDFPAFGAMPIPLMGVANTNYIYMNNTREYDWATLAEWNNATLDEQVEMLTVATDIRISRPWATPPENADPTTGGLRVDKDAIPLLNVHQMFCEGVGQFSIQCWSQDPADPLGPRWFPQLDKDGDGKEGEAAADTDFGWDASLNIIDTVNVIGVLYDPARDDFKADVGRALKFTFTLYDSRSIFKDGKTFTHIVYLDD